MLRRTNLIAFFVVIAVCLFSPGSSHCSEASQIVYRAGLPDVPGVMFLKTDGTPGGFSPEILDYAAKAEGFRLEWVTGPWPELFDKLKSGEIDVLPGVTVTPDRREYLDFIENSLYVTWSELYTDENYTIRSITDLMGKKIGLVRNDFNSEGFKKYISGFNIKYEPAIFDSHKDAAMAIHRKEIFAMAGPMSRIMKKTDPRLGGSGLFFNPSDSSIAFPKGRNVALRESIDRRIGLLKSSPDSIYVRLFNHYGLSDLKREENHIPLWIFYSLGLAIFIGLTAILFVFALRRQVRKKNLEISISEGKLNFAAELAKLGYWELDHKTGKTTWSQHLRQILEADDSERDEGEILQYIHPDDREAVLEAFRLSLVPGGSYHIQHRITTGRGHVRWLEETGHTEFNVVGAPSYTFGVSIDITEKIIRDEELRKQEQSFANIFNAIDEAVMIHEPESLKIKFANLAAFKMFGYSGETLKKLSMADLSGVGCEIEILRKMADRSGMPGGVLFEWTAKNRAGTEFPVEIALRLTDDVEGRKCISVVRNITNRKKAEEELKRKEEMLHHAQKMESLGQLAGGIAHDFNNMLLGVIGYAELIQNRVTDEKLSAYCNQIVNTSMRAADLTKQLLSFARKGRGYEMPVDVHDCIETTMSMLSRTVDRSIILSKNLTAEHSFVLGDPAQLHSSFLNLGLNARDAMPGGGIFSVTTEEIDLSKEFCQTFSSMVKPGKYIHIIVSDTGKGIAQEHLPRIFEPFFTTKTIGQGTGLGLAAVYGTVESHGGAIRVSSREGHGTVFDIYLPLAGSVTASESPASQEISAQMGLGTVLVADDEAVVREMMVTVLSELGYETISAENGLDAVEKFNKNKGSIDLVVLDIIMPEMGGVEAFQRIREIDPAARVIISSGYASSDRIGFFNDKNIDAFLNKPFTSNVFAETVARVINKEKIL